MAAPPSLLSDLRLRWALLFPPCMAAMWTLQILQPDHWRAWILLVSLTQFLLGEYARRRLFGPPQTIMGGGWRWALATVVILQGVQWALAVHQPGPLLPLLEAVARMLYMVIFVAYVEELWFRGLWFRAMGRYPLVALLSGSLLFALYHWPQGGYKVLFTFAIGLVYGAARLRGASILALALAHGLVNWLNKSALPPVALRIDTELALVIFPLICLAGALAILTWPSGRAKP